MSELLRLDREVLTVPRPNAPPAPPQPDRDPPSDGVALKNIFATLRRQTGLILAVATITLSIVSYIVLTEPPVYSSSALLRLGNARRVLTDGIEDMEVDKERWRVINPFLSQIQLLRSRELAGRVVDATGLQLRPSFRWFAANLLTGVEVYPGAPPDTLRLTFTENEVVVRGSRESARGPYGQPLSIGAVRFTINEKPRAKNARWLVLTREEAIDQLLRKLRVTPRPQTNIAEVAYVSPRPDLAQRVANSLAQTFQEIDGRGAQAQSGRRRRFLEGQLRQTDSLLRDAQWTLSEFQRRAHVSGSRDKLATQQRELMEIDMRQAELLADRRMYQALLDNAVALAGADNGAALGALVSTPAMASNRTVALLHEQLGRYQTTLDSLTTGAWRSAATNPDVKRLEDLIASTQERLVSAVRGHIASLDARHLALGELRDRAAAQADALPALEGEQMRLEQQVATIRKMADQLREEYQKARVAEAVATGEVEIVDLAARPWEPLPRLRVIKLALGLLLGLLIGCGLAFVRATMNTTIRRREELEGVLGVPGLAVIPKAASSPFGGRRRLAASGRLGGRDERVEGLITLATLPSLGTEAYRTLRTNLLFSPAAEKLCTLVVTSAAAGEGKTLTAANLAVTFAREGKRVLLVDADLRRPRVHKLFGIARTPGLTELLTGESSPEDAMKPSEVDGLWILPSGTTGAMHGDLLRGMRTRTLIRELSERFDLVIFDTAPALALTDAAILSAFADGVLLVVRAGLTDRGLVQQAIRQLGAVGARVLGAVLNDPDGEWERYGDYYAAYDYAPAASNGDREPARV